MIQKQGDIILFNLNNLDVCVRRGRTASFRNARFRNRKLETVAKGMAALIST